MSDPSPAAESFRQLRRGITRAKGFSLFVAVCNNPLHRDNLIAVLASSLAHGLDLVELSEHSTDPLDEAVRACRHDTSSPVMLIGMERALHENATDHPILQSMNLRRPEWPVLLPRPVVLWVTEHVLSILGRHAPDFMDWRSDTAYFLHGADEFIEGGSWDISEADRLSRIESLRGDMMPAPDKGSFAVRMVRVTHLRELASHLMILERYEEAGSALRKANEILATVPGSGVTRKLRQQLLGPHAVGLAADLMPDQEPTSAVETGYGVYARMARDYHRVAQASVRSSALLRAEYHCEWAADINRWLCEMGMATQWPLAEDYRLLGSIYMMRGKLRHAEDAFKRLIGVAEVVQSEHEAALGYQYLGIVNRQQGADMLARICWTEAAIRYAKAGNHESASMLKSWTAALSENDSGTGQGSR